MLLTTVLAFIIAVTTTPVVAAVMRRRNVVDLPNDRSSHRDPTPRCGGIGVALAVTAAFALVPGLGWATRAPLVIGGIAFGLVGLLEDLIGIPALRRLALLVAAAAISLPWLQIGDGPWVGQALVGIVLVVWLVGYVNAFNFMDGINGISVGQVAVAGVAWYSLGRGQDISWLAAVGVITTGGALGFLPYNLPRARVFLGDVGSYFLGAVLASTAVLALRAGLPAEAVLAPLAVYLADTGVTLTRRIARGETWYMPHRQHVYQRLTPHLSESHTLTTVLVVTVMAACAALGQLSLLGSLPLRLAGDAAILAILAAYLAAPALITRTREHEQSPARSRFSGPRARPTLSANDLRADATMRSHADRRASSP